MIIHKNNYTYITELWTRLTGKEFSSKKFAISIKEDGGEDMSLISEEMILKLLDNSFSGNWDQLTFSFTELLAYYAVGDLRQEQVVNWIFGAFIISDAIALKKIDWDLEFDFITLGLLKIKDKIEASDFVYIFSYIFKNFRPFSAYPLK